ncbi:MAG: AAA family ATPase, partial [Planctomycetota bacterium]
MRINGLEIGGFGVWTGLKLKGLGDGINVLYGPNEAGKTTLLQFVRSVLYGFSPERQQYLPPLRGGRPGGMITLGGPNGTFCLERYYDEKSDGPNHEQTTLTAADGTRQGEHMVKVLLANVDEVTFNNVFAVGLREIQELGTLGDTEAAEQLYNLTAGLDRVSLVEVIDELTSSRSRILDPQGNSCQVVKLLARRGKLREEIEELGGLTRRYARVIADRNLLQREIVRLEEENTAAENQASVVELAVALRERWTGRAELDDQLAAMGRVPVVPEGAVERIDAIHARSQKHRGRLEQLERQYAGLKEEAAELKINEALWRQAARIEALQEQQ